MGYEPPWRNLLGAPAPVLSDEQQDDRRRGGEGLAAMLAQLRADAGARLEDIAAAALGTVEDGRAIEAGKLVPSVLWLRAWSECTATTFGQLLTAQGTELPDGHGMTVAEARAMLSQLRGTAKGIQCPCCERVVLDHKRTAGKPMASFVAWLVANFTGDPLNANAWKEKHPEHARGGTYSRARWWGLAVREKGQAPLWSPTEKGKRWARGTIGIREQVIVRNNCPIEWLGERVKIHQVTGGPEPQRGEGGWTLPGLG